MKKLIALMMALCVVFGVFAAAEETEIVPPVLTAVRVSVYQDGTAYAQKSFDAEAMTIAAGELLLVEEMQDGWYHIVRGEAEGMYIPRGFIDPMPEELDDVHPIKKGRYNESVRLVKERLRELGFVRAEGKLNPYFGDSLETSMGLFFGQFEEGEPVLLSPGLVYYILNADDLPTYNGSEEDLPVAR